MTSTSHNPSLGQRDRPGARPAGRGADRKVQAGELVDPEAVAGHPEYADQLRLLMPALEMLADLGQSVAQEGTRPRRPGTTRSPGSASWATSGSSARSAGAAWASSTRPSSSRSTAAWR